MGVSNNDLIPNHRVITPPVSFADVQSVLGISSTGLSQLCTSTYINRWAKYKPVRRSMVDTVTTQWNSSTSRWRSQSTQTGESMWWNGENSSCGLSITSFTTLRDMINSWRQKTQYSWADYWQYTPPAGSSTSPYRLTDFAYFLKNNSGDANDCPFDWVSIPDTIVRYQSEGEYLIGNSASCKRRTNNLLLDSSDPTSNLLLTLSELQTAWGGSGATQGIGKYYFGIAAMPTDNTNYFSAITTKYDWETNVPSGSTDGHPAGTDLRVTPIFPYSMFMGSVNRTFIIFPFLSESPLSDTGLSSPSNPCQLADRSSNTYAISGRFIPLPSTPVSSYYKNQDATIGMSVKINSVTSTQDAVTISITYTANNLLSGPNSSGWDANSITATFQIFYDGMTPPSNTQTRAVPASSSFSGSSWPKTYTTTYNFTAARSGKNYILVNLFSNNGNIIANGGDSYNNA